MKRFSTMLVVSLAISMVVAACASMQSGGGDLVTRAVSAQGGADALAAIKTISYKATVRQWEPEQSAKAGGEMRLANDSTVVSVADVAAGATRIDWVQQLPVPGPAHASRSARSSRRRPATWWASTATAAPSRAARRTRRRIRCRASGSPPPSASCCAASPLLTLDMLKSPDRVTGASSVTVGGVRYPAADFRAGGQTLTVLFDPQHRAARPRARAGLRQHLGRRDLGPGAGGLADGRDDAQSRRPASTR